jgi:hypothetical protein
VHRRGLYRDGARTDTVDRVNVVMESRRTVSEVHGRKVLSFLPAGGRMLQWGVGASTVWFAERLPSGATLTAVEHDPAQRAAVAAALGPREDVRLLLRPPDSPVGVEGPGDEGDVVSFHAYLEAGAGERFDVVFIDGHVRGACLTAARERVAPGGVICLHDGQRPWYDAAKTVVPSWGVMGAASADDPSHLWIGGIGGRPTRPAAVDAPIVVSAVAADSGSAARARALIDACDRFGLAHDLTRLEVDPAGVAGTIGPAAKADICLAAWRRHQRPIVWLDADATILARPELLIGCDADVALYRVLDWQISGSTVFFNHTPLAGGLLEQWAERCRRAPGVPDQVSLDLAWEELTVQAPLDTLWLPASYCQMPSSAQRAGESPVIIHQHAAERLPAGGGTEPDPGLVYPSEGVYRARLAARPRQWRLPRAESPEAARESLEERLLDGVLPGHVPPGHAARLAVPDTVGWWVDVWRTDRSRLRAEQEFLDACLRDIDLEMHAWRDAIYEARLAELADRLRPHASAGFAIFGTGVVGQALLRAVRERGLAPVYFVESNADRHGQAVEGVPIVSPAACRAAGCRVYAIGSYASVEAITRVLTTTYDGSGTAPVILSPESGSPRLPDSAAASRTLLRARAALGDGHALAELGSRAAR